MNSVITLPYVYGIISNSNFKENKNAININSSNNIYSPSNPMLAVDNSRNLFLAYRENIKSYSSIVLLRTNVNNEYNEWNLTKNYLYKPNESNIIISYPDMIYYNGYLFLGITMKNGIDSFLYILRINSTNLKSTTLLKLNDSESYFTYPKLVAYNNSLWITWLNNFEGNFNLYYTNYDLLTTNQSEIQQISDNSFGNCQNSDLFIDNNGSCHIVWSQGMNYLNYLFYTCFSENQLSLMNSTVVPNTTYCNEPEIFIETNGQVNVFWSNYTEISPIQLGTKNIHYCTYSKANNWSDYEYVAPYRAIGKTEFTDGENPAVTIDNYGNLWMAYELVETYPGFSGVAVRNRNNGNWLAHEHVTTGIFPAYGTCIVRDSIDTIHCVWMDFRLAYFEIFYRARANNGIWSIEQQLTSYSYSANLEQGPKLIGIYIVGILLLGVIMPSSYYLIKRWRNKKLLENRRKEIMND